MGTRKGILNPEKLSMEERNELIKKQPAYGNIICRCEMVTEGEILDAIHRPLGARSLDGVSAEPEPEWDAARQAFVHREPWKFFPESFPWIWKRLPSAAAIQKSLSEQTRIGYKRRGVET